MTTALLDGNVLVALVVGDHTHHRAAAGWFAARRERFATCPITQGTLLRLLVRSGIAANDAFEVLASVTSHRRHEFWPDDIEYGDVEARALIGHRQITDAYLAQLARRHRGKLATFDNGLTELHGDVAMLISDRG